MEKMNFKKIVICYNSYLWCPNVQEETVFIEIAALLPLMAWGTEMKRENPTQWIFALRCLYKNAFINLPRTPIRQLRTVQIRTSGKSARFGELRRAEPAYGQNIGVDPDKRAEGQCLACLALLCGAAERSTPMFWPSVGSARRSAPKRADLPLVLICTVSILHTVLKEIVTQG